jgi:hypothetical protein
MRYEMDMCDCGRAIVQPKTGPRRKKCTTCRPRPQKPVIVNLPVSVVPNMPSVDVPIGRVVDVVRKALKRADRVDTPDGAVAIHLAALLDQGGHTGPSAASLSKEIRAACTAALAGTADASDLVDDLKARRAN